VADEQIILKKKGKVTFDIVLLLTGISLFVIGLISLYSCLYASDMQELFFKQAIFGAAGIAVAITLFFIPGRRIKQFSLPVYIAAVLLLILVLTGFGTEINGTQGWIRIAGFSLQPAELGKLGVLLIAAWRLSSKYTDVNYLRDFFIIAGLFLLPASLIMLQPDFGSFSVILVLFYGVLFWSGFSGFVLFTLACLPIVAVISMIDTTVFYIAAGVFFAMSFFFKKRIIMPFISGALFFLAGLATPLAISNLKDYQQARINTFLNPESDPLGSGYNVLQSILAIGSGGISGKGFMQGTQTQLRFIPMQWTDFIFSVPSEEFGFIGSAVIVLLFAVLFWRGIKIAGEATSKFDSIVAAGCVFIIFYHCVINMGMAMGIMPVTGIPLPFLSYGGTSLLINFTMIGLLLSINKTNKLEQIKYDTES
jgi:rod shape determining protein RodA